MANGIHAGLYLFDKSMNGDEFPGGEFESNGNFPFLPLGASFEGPVGPMLI